jgi:hypothetical protein
VEKSRARRTGLFPDNSITLSIVVAFAPRSIAGPLETFWLRIQQLVRVAFQDRLIRSPLLNDLDGGHI